MSFLDDVKAVPIIDYAQHCGLTLVKKGSKYVSLKEYDSVMIDTIKNCYWRNSVFQKGKRGGAGSIVDFAIEFMGYDAKGAIREIALIYNINNTEKSAGKSYKPTPLPPKVPPKAKEFTLPPKADNSKTVFDYLANTRKIAQSVIRYFLAKGMLYQDTNFNCVFVSNKFGCIRSVGSKRFAIDLIGCDYDECFFFRPSTTATTLVVAESVIDIMSIMTQFMAEGKRYTAYSYLALSGTGKLSSLFYHIEKEKDIDCVMLAFDNDTAGQAALKASIDGLQAMEFKGLVEDYSAPTGKDWNEHIQNRLEKRKA